MIFTLRPLYHREVGSDEHWVGGRGGSDPLEKTTMIRLLSSPLSSLCLSVSQSVCISFVPLLCCVPYIISASISSVCFFFLPHSFILHFLLLSLFHIFCLNSFLLLSCPSTTIKAVYSTYHDTSCMEQLSPCPQSWKIFQI